MKFYNNIDSAYNDLKRYIINMGETIIDQRGDKVFQIPFSSICFFNHIESVGQVKWVKIPETTILNKEGLLNYSNQLQDGDIHDFVYTYGNRFIEHFGINQYNAIINKIKDDINTRRAVAVTFDPKIDNDLEDIPCLNMIKCSVYNNRLYMTVIFRSNDIRYAFSSNMYALMNIQLMIAKKCNLDIGDFYYVGLDSHWKVE